MFKKNKWSIKNVFTLQHFTAEEAASEIFYKHAICEHKTKL